MPQVFLITGVNSLLKTLSLRRTAPAISCPEVKGHHTDQLPPPARTQCFLQTRRVLENSSRLRANQLSQAAHETGCVFSDSPDCQNRLQRNSFQKPPPRPRPRTSPPPADLVSRTIWFMASIHVRIVEVFPAHEPEEHPTSNTQRRTSNDSAHPRSLRRSMFDVGRSMFPSAEGFNARSSVSRRSLPQEGKGYETWAVESQDGRDNGLPSEWRAGLREQTSSTVNSLRVSFLACFVPV